MFELNQTAMEAYDYGISLDIIDEDVEWIVETVLAQEIVSFSTSRGTVSFDIYDLVEVE